MNKIKALTLIETLLVIVVIALILVVSANQFQRYQQARTIEQAKTAVEQLKAYVTDLYYEHCADLYQQQISLICPSIVPAIMEDPTQVGQYCDNNFTIYNPFMPQYKSAGAQNANYVVQISKSGTIVASSLGVSLPMSSSKFTAQKGGTPTPKQLIGSALFQKYVAALQPDEVIFKNQQQAYYPGYGWVSDTNAFQHPCIEGSGQDICFLWSIKPANWGTTESNAVNNQTLNNQLNAFASQYVPTKTEWGQIRSGTNNQAIINCPGLNAATVYQTKP